MIYQEKGKVLEVVLHGRGQMTYLEEDFPGDTGDRRELCKLTMKWISSTAFSKDSAKSLRALPTYYF